MRFSIDVGGELELRLQQAILLYQNDHSSRSMATVHTVTHNALEGPPTLGAGQLLTTGMLRELARTLGTACPAEFLPEQVIARTPELLAWWTPAAIRPMFFRRDSELGSVSGRRFPHPALLFVVHSGLLYLRALSCSLRPTADTCLYAAPYWNAASDGAVCAGTMRVPRSAGVATMASWEQAFFESEFTHPGGAGRLTKQKGGCAGLWKKLAGTRQFPGASLIKAEPLSVYLKRVESRR
jgi:PRTRC genetic system protein B